MNWQQWNFYSRKEILRFTFAHLHRDDRKFEKFENKPSDKNGEWVSAVQSCLNAIEFSDFLISQVEQSSSHWNNIREIWAAMNWWSFDPFLKREKFALTEVNSTAYLLDNFCACWDNCDVSICNCGYDCYILLSLRNFFVSCAKGSI